MDSVSLESHLDAPESLVAGIHNSSVEGRILFFHDIKVLEKKKNRKIFACVT